MFGLSFFEMELTNRYALLVTPRQELLEWVNAVFPEDPPLDLSILGQHDNTNIYLFPQVDDLSFAEVYVKTHLDIIFERELFEWCEDEAYWPKDRNWALFCEWFDYSIESLVFDLTKGPIRKEDI